MNAMLGEPVGRREAVILAAFAFVTIFCVNLFPAQPGGEFSESPNEFSRFDLVVSIAERGSTAIDTELSRFGRHEDTSAFSGRTYSNKPPGLSLAALPAYFLLRPILGAASPENAQTYLYGLRLATVSLSVVIALVLFARRLRRVADRPDVAPAVLFAVAFGTPLLVYARSFFSHAWTASLLYIAFELVSSERLTAARGALAGLAAGWAVLSEFPAAVIAAVLAIQIVRRSPARALAFAAGALPAAAALAIYNVACFGAPWTLSYGHEWYATHTALSKKFFGFEWPDARIAARYLFLPTRGILALSPFFVFLPASVWSLRRRRPEAGWALAATGTFFVLMCGYENWHGGWAFGSRYLLPALLVSAWPLVAIDGSRMSRAPDAFACLAAAAAALTLVATSTFWFLPADPVRGLTFYSIDWLSKGWWAPTLAGSTMLCQAPVLAATAAAAAAGLGGGGLPGRRAAAVLAGVGLAIIALAVPAPHGTFGERLTRARIEAGFRDATEGCREIVRLRSEVKSAAEARYWSQAARPCADAFRLSSRSE